MIFSKLWKQRSAKGSFDSRELSLDLLSQLSFMSAIATASISRGLVIEGAARQPYASAECFRDIHKLSTNLGYDYAQSSRVVGDASQDETLKALLLRFSTSLAAGEVEADFLDREARAHGEIYASEYEGQLESIQKWTDSYIALVVSGTIILIVAVISLMIYQTGIAFILGLALMTAVTTTSGAWIIHRSVPYDPKTHSLPHTSTEQRLAKKAFNILVPVAVCVATFPLLGVDLGWTLVLMAALIFPVGFISTLDDRKINKRDQDIAAFIRALGGVTKSIGASVTEGLLRVNLRASGSLAPELLKLRKRLASGIDPDVCWDRFTSETGSELVHRTVKIFYGGIRVGGDPDEVSVRAAHFAMKVALLRAKRRLVSATFFWVSIPVQLIVTGLPIFIVEILTLFSLTLQGMDLDGAGRASSSDVLAYSPMAGFGADGLGMLGHIVTVVILVLTAANAFAVKAPSGGHRYRLCYYLAIMMAITGLNMALIPKVSTSVFGSLASF